MNNHGTATKTTAKPTLAIVMYTTKPIPVPANEISPAVRPWLMLRDTRYIMFGPGVSTIPNAVIAIPTAAAAEITMTRVSQTDGECPTKVDFRSTKGDRVQLIDQRAKRHIAATIDPRTRQRMWLTTCVARF